MSSELIHKDRLPESELGEDRCFQIEYFGHGDMRMSFWQGDLSYVPRNDDDISKNFGFIHGNDVMLFASFAGYLARVGRSHEEISEVLLSAGDEVLRDNLGTIGYMVNRVMGRTENVASGEPSSRYDIPDQNLVALLSPQPNEPALLNEVGGTGIYTRRSGDNVYFVIARFNALLGRSDEEAELYYTADFCERDVPVLARLVCSLSMGEYRKDIQAFLNGQYINPESERFT